MKGYIICFTVTLFLAYISEKLLKKEKKTIGIIFLVGSMAVPCLIAGIRSLTVGSDINSYFNVLYHNYINPINKLIPIMNKANVEFGYAYVMYLAAKVKDIHFSLLVSQLCVCFPIYFYAYRERNNTSITLTILIFLLTMYCQSLNLMRQSIAISIIILSVSYFKQKKYSKTFFLCILATLFHSSALMAILVYYVIYICKLKKNSYIYIFALFIAIVLVTAFTDFFLMILPNRYSVYLSSAYSFSNFNITSLIKKIFWIVLSLMFLRNIKRKSQEKYSIALACFTFFVVDFILYFMSMRVSMAGRIGYYFLYTSYFLFIPIFKDIFKQKRTIVVLLIVVLIVFWYNMVVINDADNIYPYQTDYIGFLNEK